MKVHLDIKLITDITVSVSGATIGPQRTLDYLPGRMLWGAAAARLYRSRSESDCFRIFHLGAVRFSDAVVASGGARTWPTPRSWHAPKYGSGIVNLAADSGDDDKRQLQPVPAAWRAADGRAVKVKTRFTMRSAVGSDGKARAGLLYGYELLPAGLMFIATVSGERDDVEAVVDALTGEPVLLGRGRAAELGRARVTRREDPPGELDLADDQEVTEARILCVSRAAFRDPATGALVARPRPLLEGEARSWPDLPGIPSGWDLIAERCFVRTATYSPFHGKRRRPDMLRFVMEPGSVLTLGGEVPVRLADLRARLAEGIGLGVNEGLGQVVVEPRWLSERTWQEGDAMPDRVEPGPVPEAALANDPLFAWVKRRADERAGALADSAWARAKAGDLARYGVPASQWGELRQMAREARARPNGPAWLRKRIHRMTTEGVGRLKNRWGATRGGKTAGQALLECIEERKAAMGGTWGAMPAAVEQLANAALRRLKQEQHG